MKPLLQSILSFARYIRYGQASTSVLYHEQAIERAKEGLAAALAARDAALAEIRINDEQPPSIPNFLLRKEQ